MKTLIVSRTRRKSFGLILIPLLSTLVACGSGGGGGGSNDNSDNISGTTTLNVSVGDAPSSYTINTFSNPSITVQRGITYTFNLNSSGHPFYIMSVRGTDPSNAYTSGVTGNGGTTGQLTFAVPVGAPDALYYDCSVHSGMSGVIHVTN